jgi:hypothetical protein
MSTLKAINLQHPSATNPAIVLDTDGSAAGNFSSSNGGPLAGFRNRRTLMDTIITGSGCSQHI